MLSAQKERVSSPLLVVPHDSCWDAKRGASQALRRMILETSSPREEALSLSLDGSVVYGLRKTPNSISLPRGLTAEPTELRMPQCTPTVHTHTDFHIPLGRFQ